MHLMRSLIRVALVLSAASLPAGATLLTGVETDTTSAGFPPGADGEWTRFGAAYNGLTIDTNPANAAAGTNSISTAADWAAGAFYGIRYNVAGTLDISSGPIMSFQARYDGTGNPTVTLVLVEGGAGEVFVSDTPLTLTTSYAQSLVSVAPADMVFADPGAGGGNSTLDLNNIDIIGFDIRANGATSGAPLFHFDEIYWNESTLPPPALPLITSVEPPDTTSALFPPDTTSPTFPDTSVEGDWTRFGAAYNGISIVTDAATSSHLSSHLEIGADWAAGTRVGTRYLPFGQPVDWSAYDVISYDVRANPVNAGTTHHLALFEDDGDIWISADTPVPASYETVALQVSTELTREGSSTGDGTLSLAQVILVGVDFGNTGGTGAQTFSLDHLRLGNSPPVNAPVLPLVTTFDPPDFTTAGFPDGVQFEWTRFGAGYSGPMAIINDAPSSSDGANHLEATADWAGGAILGLRYLQGGLPSTPVDWSAHDTLLFDVRADTAVAGTTVEFAVFEADGDIWVSGPAAVTTGWQTVSLALPGDFTRDAASTGDANFTFNAVGIIGPNFRNSGGSGVQTLSVDHLRLSAPTSPVSDWAAYR